jgi:SAM-dependent methyltransferase
MNYCDADANLDDVVQHLRKKDMGIYPVRWSPVLRVIERVSREVARLRLRALRNAGWQAVVSERIVEEALILRHIRPEDRRVLDFGAYESLLPLTLSALGHEVTVLDQRAYPFSAPRLKSVAADLFGEYPLRPGSFDMVISVSTIEHLGLGGYEDVRIPEGDRLGVERLWQLVRPGGRLMATVPAGKPAVRRGYRTYDEARLREVFPEIAVIHWFRKDNRVGTWSPSTADAVAELVYQEPLGNLPVEAVAFVVCQKS